MSRPNYVKKYANHYYVLEPDIARVIDEVLKKNDINKKILDNIYHDLKGLENSKIRTIYIKKEDKWDNSSYPMYIFASIEVVIPIRHTINNIELETEARLLFEIGIRTGYYYGANLDYSIELAVAERDYYDYDSWEYDDIQYAIVEELRRQMKYYVNKLDPDLIDTIDKAADEDLDIIIEEVDYISNYIEKIFAKYSKVYTKRCVLSNDKAIYER